MHLVLDACLTTHHAYTMSVDNTITYMMCGEAIDPAYKQYLGA